MLAIQANNRTGTIADVEHIVILMQENRSFDHYFGTMRGVRGFADPRAVTLPSGKLVWAQPHGWKDTHAASMATLSSPTVLPATSRTARTASAIRSWAASCDAL